VGQRTAEGSVGEHGRRSEHAAHRLGEGRAAERHAPGEMEHGRDPIADTTPLSGSGIVARIEEEEFLILPGVQQEDAARRSRSGVAGRSRNTSYDTLNCQRGYDHVLRRRSRPDDAVAIFVAQVGVFATRNDCPISVGNTSGSSIDGSAVTSQRVGR
jgi:hypothetical protein